MQPFVLSNGLDPPESQQSQKDPIEASGPTSGTKARQLEYQSSQQMLGLKTDSDILRLVDCDNLSITSESTQIAESRSYGPDSVNIEEHHAERESLATDTDASRGLTGNQRAIQIRLLVRRREAGALIGKGGSNIKRLRETFRSSIFSIPDTGNGPERVVCLATNAKSADAILDDITQLLMEKSPENDEQIELKILIHSSHAGSIIGIGGQSIKKLRNDSKAAIKIYEMCCPFSNERICAIKAKPPVVVNTLKLIRNILDENPIKGTTKPYDALHFDPNLVEKYGGYLPEEGMPLATFGPIDAYDAHRQASLIFANRSALYHPVMPPKRYSVWRAPLRYNHTSDTASKKAGSDAEPEKSTSSEKQNSGDSTEETNSGNNPGPIAGAPTSSIPTSGTSNQPTLASSSRQSSRFHPYQIAANQASEYPGHNRVGLIHPRSGIYGHHASVGTNLHMRGQNRMIRLPIAALYPQTAPEAYDIGDSCQHHLSLAHQAPCFCMLMPLLGPDEISSPSNSAAGAATSTSVPTEAQSFATLQLPIGKSQLYTRGCSPYNTFRKR